MRLRTRLAERFGIEHPIISARWAFWPAEGWQPRRLAVAASD
jgi:hypothetical protein